MDDAPGAGLPKTGFGRSLTTFVGRRTEVLRLQDLVVGHRLVTITGPGGVGKTRLAAESTHALGRRFPDGIRLVELAPIRECAQVPWAVAASLGAQDDAAHTVTRSVITALCDERSLLVLDNCEHVMAAVTELCDALLSDSDDIRILATSRVPIGVAGEVQLRLTPLPASTKPSASGEADAGGPALFLDRVRLREPDLHLTPRIMTQAADIVARLDGLPLAIELAAARVESMGMSRLLEALDEPLQVLTGGARAAAPRHRSLWATADWSYQLLNEQSRRAFRRLAVLPGPFTLDTALAVAGRTAASAVFSLVDTSMIAPPREGPDGRARYLMLDTLRAYGRDQLEASGETDDARSAMSAQALLLAENAADLIQRAGGELPAAAWIDADAALLHGALLTELDHDHQRALRLAVALGPWWRLRGLRSMGYPMLSRAADQVADGQSTERRSAQHWLGRLALGNCAWQSAVRHFTKLIDAEAAQRRPLSNELVDAHVGRSAALRNLGDFPAAVSDADSGRELADALSYPEGRALALAELILAADHNEDSDAALRWHVQLREIDKTCLADHVVRRIAVADAVVLAGVGELENAARVCDRGLDSARAVRDISDQADLLDLRTYVALCVGDVGDAASHITELLALVSRSAQRRWLLVSLDHCGHLCAATDRWSDAITVWAARSAQQTPGGTPDRPHDFRRRNAALAQAHQRVAPPTVRRAERRGSTMTFQAATEFATMLATSTSSSSSLRTQDRISTGLSGREEEVVALVAQGRTDAQIAETLFISIRTVRSHLDRIRDKSGSRRRADLTRLALQHGLV